jgi:RNA polymerase sigma-54 factor
MGLTARQTQGLVLNQKMIQSISILAMSAVDLRDYIYEEAEKNPALDVVQDFEEPVLKAGRQGNAADSDAFQSFLESRPAPEETIRAHLLSQVRVLPLTESEENLCEKIIGNLDTRGFHFDTPEKLLDPENPQETGELLERCLATIRRLDPVGTACSGSAESLFVQAKLRGDAPPLALFLLDGHLDLLKNAPAITRKKIAAQLLFDSDMNKAGIGKITDSALKAAVDYIKTLEPFPAREFEQENAAYIFPDVFVYKNGARFTVEFSRDSLPSLEISSEFTQSGLDKDRFSNGLIHDAQWVIDAIQMRQNTIVNTARVIVGAQSAFFEHGPRFLRPLKMKDVADALMCNEGTISRIANGKYLQCSWGLFEIRYFFSTQATVSGGQAQSKESVKQELSLIIKEHEEQQKSNPALKKLSDKALAQKLESRGIKIARRTVAKYRAELQE